ncbi:MAG: hypothetical protein D6790_04265 [Caldilineae bacterium]|nr:MAG: hypothetical protein D6790_04265 [Caldilineae bacterium]
MTSSPTPRPQAGAQPWGRAGWLALAALTLLALALRFYRLAAIPPGLFYDEAFNGLDAYGLLSTPLGEWPIFFTGNHGREPLFIWLLGAAHHLTGLSIWTVRSVSALCGVLLTPALAWLAWEIAPNLGVQRRRAFALWSAAGVLALLWSQIFARYGIRLALFVLLETLLWAALWRAWNGTDARRPSNRTLLWWGLTGVFAGLSFYTYLPARLLPLVLAPLLPVAFWLDRPRLQASLRGVLLCFFVAVAVAAPLGLYFIENPVSFMTRIGQVSVIGREGDQGVRANLEPVFGMFIWTGDANPRSNLPGRPVFDLLLAPFFALGTLLALARARRLGALSLLVGVFVMLLPTLLSEYAPNYQRAIGALPFTVLLAALGLDGAVAFGARFIKQRSWLLQMAAWIILAGSVGVTARTYFLDWARSPDLFPAWDVGFTQLALQMAAAPDGLRTYITPRGKEHPTLAYLLEKEPETPIPEGFDGRICVRVTTDSPAHYYVLLNEDFRAGRMLRDYYPAAHIQTTVVDATGAPWAERIDQPAGGPVHFPEMIPLSAAFSDGIRLKGYWLSLDGLRAGDRLYTRLFWEVEQTPSHNYTAFVHLLQRDEQGDLIWLAGADRPPGEGTCPTTEWLPGEVVVDELQFVLPELPPGDLYLAVGFYTPEDGQRLMVPGSEDNSVLIGPAPRAGE